MAGFFDGPKPIAIAHRGGDAAGWPKRNTMAAFDSAYRLGYRYFETDVLLTKDGQVIVAHGARNPLTAKLRGTFTYRSLQNKTYKEICQKFLVGGEQIPQLPELLMRFPEVKFFIDPKTDEVLSPLCKLLEKQQTINRISVNSFSQSRVLKAHAKLGNKANFGILVWRWPIIGHVRLIRSLRMKHLDYISCHHWLINRAVARMIKKNKLFVITWTINNRRGINRAINAGVDGIISDKTDLLKQALTTSD